MLLRIGLIPELEASCFRCCPASTLQNASLEPPLDETENSRIGDSMCHHPKQPSVVNGIKVLSNVDVEYPVYFLCLQILIQLRERHVSASPWSESEAEVDEVDLVDRTQHLGNRTLDNLVFECGDARGRWPPSAFGMYVRLTGFGQYWPL